MQQRMMRDIELARIDTVMFTELSRLSRSLKDFLNIFEFAQRYSCDLVCLKTEIDTTSPYQSLVTKIQIACPARRTRTDGSTPRFSVSRRRRSGGS